MRRFSLAVVRQRRAIIVLSVLLCAVSIFAMLNVRVNYDLASYLPKDAPSTKAMGLVGDDVPNLKVYVPGVSLSQAVNAKAAIAASPHVKRVLWLDDTMYLRGRPEETIPEEALVPWYQEGGALYQVAIDSTDYSTGYSDIKGLFPDAIMAGDAANQATVISVSMREVARIIPFILPIVIFILLFATRHWFEPVLFLLSILVAILLNEGSNVFLGSVSFITRASSAVLQLAVSIDYAIFLLHRFGECREKGMDNQSAMVEAMVLSAPAVAASAMTTLFGFLALTLMDFGLGKDMGFVLAKGILFSYLTVMVFLPALAISAAKWIDKTAHRSFMPRFQKFSGVVIKRGLPLSIILIILMVPAYLGQKSNTFLYGSGGMHAPGSRVKYEAQEIERMFGRSQQMLLMVPQGDLARVSELGEKLKATQHITGVVSYPTEVGLGIPPEVIPADALAQLRSGGYDRLILAADTPEEGEEAFRLVESVRSIAASYFGDTYRLIGENVVNLDLKNTITKDNTEVLLGGIIAIGVILLLTFRSLSVPFILLLVIQGAIWINLSLPYFFGQELNYIGYEIVSSVQLGATVDYGILLTQRYLEARRRMGKREAAQYALSMSTGSILPPAFILASAGLLLGRISSNGVISQMGTILGRGALISAVMVLVVLPNLLIICDGLIKKTTRIRRESALL